MCSTSRCRLVRLEVVATLLLAGVSSSAAADDPPKTFTNSIKMQLTLIPAGEFMMGAEEDRSDTLNFFPYCDPTWLDGELPRHKVRITKPFYMGTYEVTLNQVLKFRTASGYRFDCEKDGDTTREARHCKNPRRTAPGTQLPGTSRWTTRRSMYRGTTPPRSASG